MTTFTNRELRERLYTDMDLLPFKDVEQSVRQSLLRIGESPLFPDSYGATGFVYDVRTGRLRELD